MMPGRISGKVTVSEHPERDPPPSVPAASSTLVSTASNGEAIARPFGEERLMAPASAAPVQRKEKTARLSRSRKTHHHRPRR